MTKTDEAPLAILAAGGTGGHMFPAEALARALMARGWRIVLATDRRGEVYASNFPCEMRLDLDAATFRGLNPVRLARALVSNASGVIRARRAITELHPRVVVGFGGYPSLPTLIAALSARVPSVIHEQNAVLGRTNRLLAPHVGHLASGFPVLERARPVDLQRNEVVGNPVRAAVLEIADLDYPDTSGPLRLLVTGGSQGARLLSLVVPKAVALLPEALQARLRIAQQTRPEILDEVRALYDKARVEVELAPFFSDMGSRLASAHLVIGRAGASTCAELAVAGRPSLLVPLAIAADDHQRLNAEHLRQAGAAEVMSESELTPERLAERLEALLGDSEGLRARASSARAVAMKDATARLADLVEKAARP